MSYTCTGRSGPSTHPGLKFDRRNLQASHGLAGMMQSFRARFLVPQQIRFLSVDSVSRFL
jgi:hypothetical protein